MRTLFPDQPLDLLANDMWALGALLVFMLTGQDLFGTPLPDALTAQQMQQHRQKGVVGQQVAWVRAYQHNFAVSLWLVRCLLTTLADAAFCNMWEQLPSLPVCSSSFPVAAGSQNSVMQINSWTAWRSTGRQAPQLEPVLAVVPEDQHKLVCGLLYCLLNPRKAG